MHQQGEGSQFLSDERGVQSLNKAENRELRATEGKQVSFKSGQTGMEVPEALSATQ